MDFILNVNPNDPPAGSLMIANLINSRKTGNVKVIWKKDWKSNSNVQLLENGQTVLAEKCYEVARYFGRTIDPDIYGGTDVYAKTEVDHWLTYAIRPLDSYPLKESSLQYLDKVLMTNTWLVAKKLTIADVFVFFTLLNNEFLETHKNQYSNITRWYKQMLSLDETVETLSSVAKNRTSQPIKKMKRQAPPSQPAAEGRKQEGKFIELPGAEMGKVVVRFPPEASGYLHIGHAKAALLNQYYANAFEGQLIMRFDDTNPAKENVEYEQAILEDLEMLQIKPDRFTHSSDYFDLMLDHCTKLINEGKAFVDDTPADVMKEQRDKKEPSANRENSVEKNLQLWKEMQKGTPKGQECCVRAKIDYESVNGCLRDPTIYRCKPEPHPRTGTKYKVYPTYDFACPIVDAIEGVTHTLRTTEYHDRDAQFYWFVDALKLRRPYIWEYSRLNMTNTVLSKRKLTWLVNEGIVDGWDDPRFPTVRGILRRGMTVEGLKQFIIAQGSSRSVVFMEWDKIWAFNKKVIDPIATRYTALNYDELVPVEVVGVKDEILTVQNHPKDASKGTKQVRVGPKLLIEKSDAKVLVEKQNTTFINWGNLFIEKIEKSNGEVVKVIAKPNLEDKNYKNTLKITWLAEPPVEKIDCENELVECFAVYFDHIISKPVLGKDEEFKDFVAKDTRHEVQMLGETALKRVKKGEIIQLQRKGFFRCDVPYAPLSPFSCRVQPVILFHIPDGHVTTTNNPQKSTSTNKSSAQSSCSTKNKNDNQSAESLNQMITLQGDKVRKLKTEKADKAKIDAEVKTLVELKAQYKTVTGSDWKPGAIAATATKSSLPCGDNLSKEIKEKTQRFEELMKMMEEEAKQLMVLKNNYKSQTGKEWKLENESVTDSSMDIKKLSESVQKQGDKVRELKTSKADKKVIDEQVKILLALKSKYKTATGKDWKPEEQKKNPLPIGGNESPATNKANEISERIQQQGNKVRELKSSKADKKLIDEQVKLLLEFKAEYKNATGKDWKPLPEGQKHTSPIPENKSVTNDDGNKISEKIQKQGDKIRELKSSKADKKIIDEQVKILLGLKAEYKSATGKDWKPEEQKKTPTLEERNGNKISEEIEIQGNKVRELKNAKADKNVIDEQVKVLLSLKAEYKSVTGQDWQPPAAPSNDASKKKKKDDASKSKTGPGKSLEGAKGSTKEVEAVKTGTRLGLEAKKEENFFEWYSQVITKSGMIEYYDVSGCYILRPWSFAVWKIIKNYIDAEITKLGVQECYFPIFVTRAVLEKEKSHISDFAPEVAWVTKCGDSDLAEPIAIRPTSETVMYPAYAKWLRSDTELPLRLNQWNNVVRWEFKDPKPFLRTREFLWQEGHTAFATKAEADEEVLIILDIYAKVYEHLMAVPVIKGRKTEKEKFAGGDYTTTVEAFISTSGRGIQGATSHHLGQNFSKMFNIQIEGAKEGDEKTFIYQNSWGLTTRTIGVLIMVHGDDKGLVLPPNVACVQAIIVPCGITATTTPEMREKLHTECEKLLKELSENNSFRVKADFRSNRTPGWKFNHWELKGVPVRVELGPKDMEKNQVTFVRRDNSQRLTASRSEVSTFLQSLLEEIQSSMLKRAKSELDSHIKQMESWDNFCGELNKKNLILAPFCGDENCEENIKADSAREDTGEEPGVVSMGAKSLCIPFEQPKSKKPVTEMKCVHPKCSNRAKFYTLFGRSY